MLRPQDTSTRERKSLNGLWSFALDTAGEGRSRRWFAEPLRSAREMAVPPASTTSPPTPRCATISGTSGIRRTCWVPRGWHGRRIVLHFESATHRATVWVNDVEVVSHEGGYTPFEADITAHVAAGEQVRITVVRQQHAELPVDPARRDRGHPGRQAAALLARLLQLRGNPSDSLAVRHRPGPRHRRHRRHRPGRQHWRDRLRDRSGWADDVETRVILRDADGAEIAANDGPTGTLRIPNVHKWAPGDGYLYGLEVQLVRGDTVVDSYIQTVGVRTVKVDGIRFLINGEPFLFKGFGKHEDLPVIGKGHNDAYLLHDFELLKWIGRTRSAPRTTRTRKTSSTMPTGRASY